jgi:hypothetical protein
VALPPWSGWGSEQDSWAGHSVRREQRFEASDRACISRGIRRSGSGLPGRRVSGELGSFEAARPSFGVGHRRGIPVGCGCSGLRGLEGGLACRRGRGARTGFGQGLLPITAGQVGSGCRVAGLRAGRSSETGRRHDLLGRRGLPGPCHHPGPPREGLSGQVCSSWA